MSLRGDRIYLQAGSMRTTKHLEPESDSAAHKKQQRSAAAALNILRRAKAVIDCNLALITLRRRQSEK